jgi:hypothetical protein
LNGTAYDLNATAIMDLDRIMKRHVTECCGGGGTLHGANVTVTLPARW